MKKFKKQIYLNAADGRKELSAGLRVIKANPKKLFQSLKNHFAEHFNCNPNEIEFAQNISTHLIHLVKIAKKTNPKLRILIDNSEVKWIKKSFEEGRLITEEMTYPNWAQSYGLHFQKSKVIDFNPIEFSNNIKKFLNDGPAVIILSHVSRLTGERLPIKKIYGEIKKISPESILLIDGAQLTGAKKFSVKNSSDAYITTTSKFIGAEPNLGVAFVSNKLKKYFIEGYPKIHPDKYVVEAYSANQKLNSKYYKLNFSKKINDLRNLTINLVKDIRGVSIERIKNQSTNILTLNIGNVKKTKEIVEKLKNNHNVIVSHNMDYSVVEPNIPLLRISISPTTTISDLKQFAKSLKKIMNV